MLLKKFLILIFLYPFNATSFAQNGEQEATLKAAFLYNFTKYIDWGNNQYQNTFVIGVIGYAPIVESLEEIAINNKVNNKRIVVKVFKSLSEIRYCNILYIPRENHYPLSSILNKAGKGVLTISEKEGFAKHGTAFNFIIINNRLRFEANLKAISSAGLKAGSQLLKLAIIVG